MTTRQGPLPTPLPPPPPPPPPPPQAHQTPHPRPPLPTQVDARFAPVHPIKAIEASDAGCRFRSRLEARWAVIFDALGIAWEYEPQGYAIHRPERHVDHGPGAPLTETLPGVPARSWRYLPDFEL